MKSYEIVLTYLNGCAGAAYPQISFDEAQLLSPEEYLREKHGKDFEKFEIKLCEPGKSVWKFDNGCISYTYEFNEV